MRVLSIAMVTILLVYVEGAPSDCAESYHQLIEDAIGVKKTCETAAFRDCCQVSRILRQ